jgi:hypothetical protein
VYHIHLNSTYSPELVITVCQYIADSVDNGDRIVAIIINFLNAFDLVPPANSGVKSRIVVWIREFPLGRMQRIRVGGQLHWTTDLKKIFYL